MHGFLIERYRILGKNRIISAVLYLPALTALCGGIIVTWAVGVKYTQAEDRPKQRTFVTCVLSFMKSGIQTDSCEVCGRLALSLRTL